MKFDLFVFFNALDIAAVAHSNISIVAAQQHLVALGNDIAVTDTGINNGLCAAITNGLDLLNGIGDLHQPLRSGEQLCLEISPQTEAHNGDVIIIYDGAELIDLLGRHKLAFVQDDHIAAVGLVLCKKGVDIHICGDHLGGGLQADAAFYHILTVPGICTGLDEPNIQIVSS